MISSFSGEYRFLSNFWMCDVPCYDMTYPSSEHAYQAHKTEDMNIRHMICGLSTPGQAKRAGQDLQLRPHWNGMRVSVMTAILESKFRNNPDLLYRLDRTKCHTLIEGNTWGDTFWGQCPLGKGKNNLGNILMNIRDNEMIRKMWDS